MIISFDALGAKMNKQSGVQRENYYISLMFFNDKLKFN